VQRETPKSDQKVPFVSQWQQRGVSSGQVANVRDESNKSDKKMTRIDYALQTQITEAQTNLRTLSTPTSVTLRRSDSKRR